MKITSDNFEKNFGGTFASKDMIYKGAREINQAILNSKHIFDVSDYETMIFLNCADCKLIEEIQFPFTEFGVVFSDKKEIEKLLLCVNDFAFCLGGYLQYAPEQFGYWAKLLSAKSNDDGRFEYQASIAHGALNQQIDKIEFKISNNFFLNFLNLINSKHCTLIEETEYTSRQERRRLERKGTPNKPVIKLRIDDFLKRCIKHSYETKNQRGTDASPYWVRGFWRLLSSQRYTHKRGQLIWISPFIKGDKNKEIKPKIYQLGGVKK